MAGRDSSGTIDFDTAMKSETTAIREAMVPRLAKPISVEMLSDCLRFYDVFVVFFVAVVIYFAYAHHPGNNIQSQYVVAVVFASAISGGLFQRFGLYSIESLFSQGLRGDRALMAWAVAFAVFLTLAFTLKITSVYSRVWAVSWFGGTAGLLIGGRLVLSHWIHQSTVPS